LVRSGCPRLAAPVFAGQLSAMKLRQLLVREEQRRIEIGDRNVRDRIRRDHRGWRILCIHRRDCAGCQKRKGCDRYDPLRRNHGGLQENFLKYNLTLCFLRAQAERTSRISNDGLCEPFATLGKRAMSSNTAQERSTLFGIDRTSTSQLVDQLEAAGLVERHLNGADRRAWQLQLTARGRKLRQRLQPRMRAANARILEPLSSAEGER
jgi:hypothetical protein